MMAGARTTAAGLDEMYDRTMTKYLAADNFLLPNGTFFAELVAFLLMLFVFWKFVVPPLSESLRERQEMVRKLVENFRGGEPEADGRPTTVRAGPGRGAHRGGENSRGRSAAGPADPRGAAGTGPRGGGP